MTYQELIDVMRSCAATALEGGGSFMHGRRSDGSLNTIDKGFPQIHLYPTRSTVQRYPEIRTVHPILLGIYDQDTPDSSPETREISIAYMDRIARAFMDQLEKYSDISLTSYDIEPVYRIHAGTVSGVAVSFTITAGENCLPEE